MRHQRAGKKLNRAPAHRKALYANLAGSIIVHGRIKTTVAKAKAVRPVAEKMITLGRRGDVHARRQALGYLRSQEVVHQLFADVAPRFADRPGGYTRIVKIGPRKGDNAPMAVIELVEPMAEQVVAEAEGATRRAAKKGAAKEAASKKSVAPAAAAADEADVTAEPVGAEPAGAELAAESTVEVTDAAAAVAEAEGDVESAIVAFADLPPEDTDEGGPYGPDSVGPTEDGSAPEGFTVKGNEDSKLYHTPESPSYDTTIAEVWFRTVEAAEAAGFSKPKNA